MLILYHRIKIIKSKDRSCYNEFDKVRELFPKPKVRFARAEQQCTELTLSASSPWAGF